MDQIGTDPDNIRFLVGKSSNWKALTQARHSYSLCISTIHMEHREKCFTNQDRATTYLTVWRFITGYPIYEAVYNNPFETRIITAEGIKEMEPSDDGDIDWADFKHDMISMGAMEE